MKRNLISKVLIPLIILLIFPFWGNPQTFTTGNIAVFQAAASANNTTGSILELNPSIAGQSSPVNTYNILGTGTSALRFSGSAATTVYLSTSNDGTLLCFTGANSSTTTGNTNGMNPRGVGTLNNSFTFSLPTTYTGTSGNQPRGATTINDSIYYFADQGGFYTNGSTAASPSGNIRCVKPFGGTVYAFTAVAANPSVGIISAATGGSLTGLTGLPNGATTNQDFYLISSGSNGSTYDILYIIAASTATAGTIYKYSLVSGTWTANSSYATTFGGFCMCAAKNGSGVNLYVTTGLGSTTNNSVISLSDTTGYNTNIGITTANNITLYTATGSTILKGIAFAPISSKTSPIVSTGTTSNISSTTATCFGGITSNGGAPILQRGICYSTTAAPDTTNNKVINTDTTATFSVNITVLNYNTLYHYRAFAINSVGISYGADSTFNTLVALPTVITDTTTSIGDSSALASGNVISDGGGTITARGICYDINANPTITGNHTTENGTTGVFTSSLTNLNPNTTYHIRAYATNQAGTAYGADSIFTTLVALPIVTTGTITLVNDNSALASGNVISDGSGTITARGICYDINVNPAITGTHTTETGTTGVFTSSLTNLNPNTTYHVRAYATNSAGTAYGNDSIFTTLAALPTVTTGNTTNIGIYSATVSGTITNNGGASITEKGICWGTTPNITIADSYFSDTSSSANISGSITGLNPSTQYYIRAYAVNQAGIAYGDTVSFTTLPFIPTYNISQVKGINTQGIADSLNVYCKLIGVVNSINYSNYGYQFNILDENNGIFVYKQTTLADYNTVKSGDSLRIIGKIIQNPGNINNIYYGTIAISPDSIVTISTGAALQSPINITALTNDSLESRLVKMDDLYYISGWSGTGTRTVMALHGTDTVTIRITSNCNLYNVTPPSATVSFSITGIVLQTSVNTTAPYVGGYKIYPRDTNDLIINYTIPVVLTGTTTGITQTSAVCKGNVTSDGGYTITSRGICYNLNANPTTSDSVVTVTGTMGTFNANLSNLTSGIIYHYRAFAINFLVTSYGVDSTFTTATATVAPIVETGSVSLITDSSASVAGTIINNGGDPVTEKGICWGLTPNLTIAGNHSIDTTSSAYIMENITGLNPNTHYYARAYATNSIGTAYGDTVSFNTSISITTTIITGPSTVCQGQTEVTYSVPIINDATSYSWTLPIGATGTSDNDSNSIVVSFSTSAASGNITLIAYNTSGDEITAILAVTVYPVPLSPGATTPVTYCQNTNASELTATGNNLLWYTTATGDTGSTIIPTPATNIVGSNDYYVSQTVNGCESQRAVIIVNINPSYNIYDSLTICQGDSIVVGTHTYNTTSTHIDTLFTVSGCDSIITTNLTVNPTYNITSNKSICQGDSLVVGTHVYTTSGGYIDTLKTIAGCDSIITTILTVNPNPIVSINNANDTICSGSTANMIGTGASTFIWWENGNLAYVSDTVSLILNQTTSFYLYGTDSNGCVGFDSTTVTVIPLPPTPVITMDQDSLVSSASAGNQWYEASTGIIPGATTQTYLGSINHAYFVIVTLDGCSSDTSNIIDLSTPGFANNENPSFNIYPNPNNGNFKVVFSKNMDADVKIFSMVGSLIEEKAINTTTTDIDLSAYGKGMYLIRITNRKTGISSTEKLIVE